MMRLPIPLLRFALLGAVLALILGPAEGQTQNIDPDRLNLRDLDLKTLAAELEIPTFKADARVDQGGTLRLIVAVKNNGQLRGSFDYALGSRQMDKVWWKESGADLKGGERDVAAFVVAWADLNRRLVHTEKLAPAGWSRVCLGLYLLKRNSSDPWTDANNPNHRKSVCFEFYGVPVG